MSELPDGPWSIAQGEYDGRPLIVRINTGAADSRADATLRHRVGIAVPLRAPRPDGLPGAEESATLDAIEDALAAQLEVGRTAVQLLVISTSGMREFVYQTRSPEQASVAAGQVGRAFPSHEVQYSIAEDPEWEVYQQFAGAL